MTKLKLCIPVILIFAGISNLRAQNGPVASGGDASGGGGTVSYSVGQIDYMAANGSGGNTNEGLQQPYEIFTFGIEDAAISLQLSLYPNPTTHIVFLNIEKDQFDDLSFQLFDLNGKQIYSQNINDKTTPINLEAYSSGSYILHVLQSNQPIQSFKIIKK